MKAKKIWIDESLYLRITKLQKLWREMFGEELSCREISKILGEYSTINLKEIKKMRDAYGRI